MIIFEVWAIALLCAACAVLFNIFADNPAWVTLTSLFALVASASGLLRSCL